MILHPEKTFWTSTLPMSEEKLEELLYNYFFFDDVNSCQQSWADLYFVNQQINRQAFRTFGLSMSYQFVYPILNDNRRLYLSQIIYNENANCVTFIFCIADTITQLLVDEKFKFVMLLDERYKMSFKEYKEYEKLLNL